MSSPVTSKRTEEGSGAVSSQSQNKPATEAELRIMAQAKAIEASNREIQRYLNTSEEEVENQWELLITTQYGLPKIERIPNKQEQIEEQKVPSLRRRQSESSNTSSLSSTSGIVFTHSRNPSPQKQPSLSRTSSSEAPQVTSVALNPRLAERPTSKQRVLSELSKKQNSTEAHEELLVSRSPLKVGSTGSSPPLNGWSALQIYHRPIPKHPPPLIYQTVLSSITQVLKNLSFYRGQQIFLPTRSNLPMELNNLKRKKSSLFGLLKEQ